MHKKNNSTKESQKIFAVLPCRIQSTRLLAKPLQLVGKYPILSLLINQIKKSKLTDGIVLAISNGTGHELFVEFARKQKIKFVLGDESDVLGRIINGAKLVNADLVLRTTSENPFIYWEGIDPLIKRHIEGNFDFSYHSGLPLGCGLEVINLNILKLSHKLGNKKHRSELSTLYIYEHQKKFKIQKFVPKTNLLRPEFRLTVDTPQDLWVARIIHNALGKNANPVSLEKIIKFLDSHTDVSEINSTVPLKYTRYM